MNVTENFENQEFKNENIYLKNIYYITHYVPTFEFWCQTFALGELSGEGIFR